VNKEVEALGLFAHRRSALVDNQSPPHAAHAASSAVQWPSAAKRVQAADNTVWVTLPRAAAAPQPRPHTWPSPPDPPWVESQRARGGTLGIHEPLQPLTTFSLPRRGAPRSQCARDCTHVLTADHSCARNGCVVIEAPWGTKPLTDARGARSECPRTLHSVSQK
jgi:hypothetical protein